MRIQVTMMQCNVGEYISGAGPGVVRVVRSNPIK